jgi:RNA polymerase sigma factor (sigma-70 family)
MRSGGPGPVLIDMPVDVQLGEVEFDIDTYEPLPVYKPAATRKQIEKAFSMLNGAERPLIVAGGGIINADAADLLPASDDSLPERALERDEDSLRYRAALAALPAEQRDVYLLHEESDLSLEEIARVTGVGAETAKSRLRYAVNKLKAALMAAEDPA